MLAVVVGLIGCGRGDGKKAATQVAAKVNSDEITVHQINDVLGKIPDISPGNADSIKREILRKLVDRQLAMQQAIKNKLDRTPAVVSAIEAARIEILARAYIEQQMSAQMKPTARDINAYYNAHPELFSERRVYNFQEITFTARADLLASVNEQVVQGHTMSDISTWLKARNVEFAVNGSARAAEQIPIDILPRIHAMKDGQTLVLD
ncbi:MAG: EpsD family peptidyl-prolyl cis-trans isomerase, partial [Candidatus Pacebacteria bacterium]|nr:EpsD family peptidyl-prolyl cis-trans isomerase [Candidatus Paceibacterota bacterium]